MPATVAGYRQPAPRTDAAHRPRPTTPPTDDSRGRAAPPLFLLREQGRGPESEQGVAPAQTQTLHPAVGCELRARHGEGKLRAPWPPAKVRLGAGHELRAREGRKTPTPLQIPTSAPLQIHCGAASPANPVSPLPSSAASVRAGYSAAAGRVVGDGAGLPPLLPLRHEEARSPCRGGGHG
jgi:hypothetical protein